MVKVANRTGQFVFFWGAWMILKIRKWKLTHPTVLQGFSFTLTSLIENFMLVEQFSIVLTLKARRKRERFFRKLKKDRIEMWNFRKTWKRTIRDIWGSFRSEIINDASGRARENKLLEEMACWVSKQKMMNFCGPSVVYRERRRNLLLGIWPGGRRSISRRSGRRYAISTPAE